MLQSITFGKSSEHGVYNQKRYGHRDYLEAILHCEEQLKEGEGFILINSESPDRLPDEYQVVYQYGMDGYQLSRKMGYFVVCPTDSIDTLKVNLDLTK